MNPVDDLVLCTINTGSLYDEHCRLARTGATSNDWLFHVRMKAIPEFRKSGSNHLFSISQASRAADELKAYYDAHIAEG